MTQASARPPHWVLTTFVGLLCGAVGFVAKDQYASWRSAQDEIRSRQADELSALVKLSSLLEESYSLFQDQNYKARRLHQMLRENHPGEFGERCAGKACGFDEAFSLMADLFANEEAELQKLIRSTTMNSQRRVNAEMMEWLKADASFTPLEQRTPPRQQLAKQLDTLKLHLNLWFDKYQAWIPNDAKRSLVYLADERRDGVGFPAGIKDTVGEVIETWPAEGQGSNPSVE